MTEYGIVKRLKQKGYLIADGATGTELIKLGVLKKGITPEKLLLDDPDSMIKVHRSYYEAGSDYVVANNFGATRMKLEEWGLESRFDDINRAAVRCVKKALKLSGKKAFVASSIGPTGKLLPPLGAATMQELISLYREQIEIMVDEGVDLFVIETMSDLREAKAAYIAIRDICDIPVGVCLTFDENGKTLLNNSPETFAVAFDPTDVLFMGVNCSVGPDKVGTVISAIGEYTNKPLIVNPNAGVACKNYSEDDFKTELNSWIAAGARIFGGCCGTGPSYVKMFARELKNKKLSKKIKVKEGTHLASLSTIVTVAKGLPTAIIGERINPTGKKQMAEELKTGSLETVITTAREQVGLGAHLLDVNFGAAGVDQVTMMGKAFHILSSLFDTPLVVDSSDERVIEAALRSYGGKALINSTTADAKKMNAVFALAKKYGAAVICLTMDEKGIPIKAESRLALAEKMLKKAKSMGIRPHDLVIDTLTLSLSSNQNEAMETIKALELVGKKLSLCTSLGVSNVSYGLPERAILNQTFLTLAVNAGLNLAIINPSSEKMTSAIDAMNVIKGHDTFSVDYVKKYSGVKMCASVKPAEFKDPLEELKHAIIGGDEVSAANAANKLAEKGIDLLDSAEKVMIPAMEVVGQYFKSGKYFLPQVVLSAQAMKKAFVELKKHNSGQKMKSQGLVLMATVKGDIHDIGKNIVITLLETNGFEVVDLGKSVSSAEIIKKAKDVRPDIIGLSALMTTTMDEMGTVITELREQGLDIPVMVGGAVITNEFAQSIGAKFYAKDAMQAVDILKKFKSA